MHDQIFLSYSRTDRAASVLLRSALEQAGLTVFRDADRIHASDRWITELERALDNCSAFVVLIGREGVHSVGRCRGAGCSQPTLLAAQR